ncbi:MAG: hypothetical protein D6698_14410 [Gammaproteobacteria bacterium]|nr:MAG: hypothetical protein D6698_14410 [Gammaproteobacteria bacterium]
MAYLKFDRNSLQQAFHDALTRRVLNPVIKAFLKDNVVFFEYGSGLTPDEAFAAHDFDLSYYGDFSEFEDEDGQITDPETIAQELTEMCLEEPPHWLNWVYEALEYL